MFCQRRNYQSFFIVALILACITIPEIGETDDSECMQAKIWIDKQEFLPYEPILIHYEIRNMTDRVLLTNFNVFKEDFVIIDQSGKRYPNLFHIDCIYGDTIQPDEIKVDSEYIELRYHALNITKYKSYLDVPGQDFDPLCSIDSKSNEISFSVKVPEGDNYLAYRVFQRVNPWSQTRDPDTDKKTWMKESFQALIDLAEKYPHTIYAPLSLYAALNMNSAPDDKVKLITIGQRLIEKYPEFPYAFRAFTPLIEVYKISGKRNEALNYLNELIDKYPNSKISDHARYWRGMMEKDEF